MWIPIYNYLPIIHICIYLKTKTIEQPTPNNIIALQQNSLLPTILQLFAAKREGKAQSQKLTDPPDLMEWTAVRQQFSPGQRERRTSPSQRQTVHLTRLKIESSTCPNTKDWQNPDSAERCPSEAQRSCKNTL